MKTLIFALFLSFLSVGQGQSLWSFVKKTSTTDTIKISNDPIFCDKTKVTDLKGNPIEFTLLCPLQSIVVDGNTDTVVIQYLNVPEYLLKEFFAFDTTMISSYNLPPGSNQQKYTMQEPEIFNSRTIQKNGSISRGFTIGNNQSLVFNSTLNLQLSGKVANNLFLEASISDRNIPFQANGNTQVLSEFDQVYLRIYNNKFSLLGGDFFLNSPTGYFSKYQKKVQGVQVSSQLFLDTAKANAVNTSTSFSFSKGRFARNEINGIEGSQGPYRLTGNQGEVYVVVLSGTERVYLNGSLLTRGENNDYTINYNTAEVFFTPKNHITKDSRIIVEFQYSNQNYSRTLFENSSLFSFGKWSTWLNVYSEQDAKNNPINITLSEEEKFDLSRQSSENGFIWVSGIESVGYNESEIRYEMVDSLGYDSVLVQSYNTSSSIYRVRFSELGPNNGNYIIKEYLSMGKVFEWVAPINGVPQGNYEPILSISTPNSKLLMTSGFGYTDSNKTKINFEAALSNFNGNTFNSSNSKIGFGLFSNIFKRYSLKNDGFFTFDFNSEFRQHGFTPIERYRSVEFTRDWTYISEINANQLLSNISVGFNNNKYNVTYQLKQFLDGGSF